MKVATAGLDSFKAYQFIVVFSRYNDKWLYCRAKERDTYEAAGGHIEEGETTLEAAKRELYEETGAVKFDIEAVFDYTVKRKEGLTYGQVFLAQIHELGNMPDFEMAEVKLFESIPERMRFPQILPVLYRELQSRLSSSQQKNNL